MPANQESCSKGKATLQCKWFVSVLWFSCSKDSDEALIDDYLLLTKHGDRTPDSEDSWAAWEAQPVKVVPPVETVDTLRSMQVRLTAAPLPALPGGSVVIVTDVV